MFGSDSDDSKEDEERSVEDASRDENPMDEVESGGEGSEKEGSEKEGSVSADDNGSDDARSRELASDGGEEEEIVGPRLYADPDDNAQEEPPIVPTLIELEMARCCANLGREGPLFVKFPNFLSVETKPFDPETYEDELEDEDVLDEEGRARVKLKIENTIRWRTRKDDDGNDVRESNAKIVKWSDGTMSLYLGKEIFDVESQKVMDHNHLFIRQGAGLQAQSVFTDKLVFRPHSTETLTHRKVTLNMADKSNKAQKVKVMTDVTDNPETRKMELIRKEEERLRASARREAQQRRVRDRPRASGLSSGFLEGGGYDSDDNEESLGSIKRSFQQRSFANSGAYEAGAFDSDSDASDRHDDGANRRRSGGGSASTTMRGGIDSDESDASDLDASRRSKQQTKRKIVIDEDDD